jgi:hypothetical protein
LLRGQYTLAAATHPDDELREAMLDCVIAERLEL